MVRSLSNKCLTYYVQLYCRASDAKHASSSKAFSRASDAPWLALAWREGWREGGTPHHQGQVYNNYTLLFFNSIDTSVPLPTLEELSLPSLSEAAPQTT